MVFYGDYLSPNQLYKPTMWTEAWTKCANALFLYCRVFPTKQLSSCLPDGDTTTFSMKKIRKAIDNLYNNVFGRGVFSTINYGTLEDGICIAIKSDQKGPGPDSRIVYIDGALIYSMLFMLRLMRRILNPQQLCLVELEVISKVLRTRISECYLYTDNKLWDYEGFTHPLLFKDSF